jgi:two-component system, OmpR family, sensor histidine kinase MtrB
MERSATSSAPRGGSGSGRPVRQRPDWEIALRRSRLVRGVLRRLPRRVKRALRAALRWARSVVALISYRWHRSLQLRVIGTTLAISAAVIAVLGFFLTEQIAEGLLLNAEHSARIQTLAGLNYARALPSLNTQPNGTQAERFMYDAAQALQPSNSENTGYYVAVGLSPRHG